ncbi:MAG: MotA/TolQ/ExbB proton channel family protein [Deltaproteobacteria bacterium]|nr:MotA/TolQ/ExbB proton channel family protein [Deltaproteobacteria bacterium]
MTELFDILNAGGIFMYGILATSLFSVAVILQRVFSLFLRFRLDTNALKARVGSHVAAGDHGKALQLCKGAHPVQAIMTAALLRAGRGEKEIRRSVETTAVPELARYRHGTASLPQLSNLATLLGLLGTIHGLIVSFSGMQGQDAVARQAALSKGVAIAFYNTFFGLTVATVTAVAYLIVSSKQGKELTRMEHAVSSLIDQLLTAPEPRSRGEAPVLRIRQEA